MSKRVRYPDGAVVVVSDEVAEILAARPGHAIVRTRPDSADAKREAELAQSKNKEAL